MWRTVSGVVHRITSSGVVHRITSAVHAASVQTAAAPGATAGVLSSGSYWAQPVNGALAMESDTVSIQCACRFYKHHTSNIILPTTHPQHYTTPSTPHHPVLPPVPLSVLFF